LMKGGRDVLKSGATRQLQRKFRQAQHFDVFGLRKIQRMLQSIKPNRGYR